MTRLQRLAATLAKAGAGTGYIGGGGAHASDAALQALHMPTAVISVT